MSLRKIIINKRDHVILLLWLFFIFLVVVQGASLYSRASTSENERQSLAKYTAESMATQASTSLRSQVNLLKTVIDQQLNAESYGYSNVPEERLRHLNQFASSLIGGYDGLMLLDPLGNLVSDHMPSNREVEKRTAQTYIKNDASLFSDVKHLELSQSLQQKSLYFYFKLMDKNNQPFYLVMVREVQVYAERILNNQFDGFELWLLDSSTQKVVIGSGKIIERNQRKDLNTASSCLLYTSPSPRDKRQSRMPSSA